MIFRAVSCLLLSLAHSESLETGSVRLRTDLNCPLLDGVFVSIMRRIFNPGYHKVLHYITLHELKSNFTCQELLSEVEIMLTTTLLPDRCTLLVEETIPRGAYVDPDQVRDLRYKA